jgi:hypothetical protein
MWNLGKYNNICHKDEELQLFIIDQVNQVYYTLFLLDSSTSSKLFSLEVQ